MTYLSNTSPTGKGNGSCALSFALEARSARRTKREASGSAGELEHDVLPREKPLEALEVLKARCARRLEALEVLEVRGARSATKREARMALTGLALTWWRKA